MRFVAISLALALSACGADRGEATDIMALGGTAIVGPDYVVTVTHVNLNANDRIRRASESNPPPKGQYVIATLSALYVGNQRGHPRVDLSTTYVGPDSRTHEQSDCSADLGEPQSADQPVLLNGGKATYSVCFDLPENAISGGRVGVTQNSSPSDHRTLWEINP